MTIFYIVLYLLVQYCVYLNVSLSSPLGLGPLGHRYCTPQATSDVRGSKGMGAPLK